MYLENKLGKEMVKFVSAKERKLFELIFKADEEEITRNFGKDVNKQAMERSIHLTLIDRRDKEGAA